MSHTSKPEDNRQLAEWAVYQCVNGCVHVRLQHVTLTFSPCEFTQLARLLDDARAGSSACEPPSRRCDRTEVS